jgi:hypothetical protein
MGGMAEERFALQWDRPFLPGASTHVSLFDGPVEPPYVVASGHGSGDAGALMDLWRTLVDGRESADAIAFVAEAYRALTGHEPRRAHSR